MRTLGRIVALCFTKRIIPPILLLLLSAAPACNWFRDFDFARGARVTGGNPELGRKQLAQQIWHHVAVSAAEMRRNRD